MKNKYVIFAISIVLFISRINCERGKQNEKIDENKKENLNEKEKSPNIEKEKLNTEKEGVKPNAEKEGEKGKPNTEKVDENPENGQKPKEKSHWHKMRTHAPETPQQVHIALTNNVDEMNVTWITFKNVDTFVEYWEEGKYETRNYVLANSTKHEFHDVLKNIPEFANTFVNPDEKLPDNIRYIHTATMKKLGVDKIYEYRVGHCAPEVPDKCAPILRRDDVYHSDENYIEPKIKTFYFRTFPRHESRMPFTIAVFGDMGLKRPEEHGVFEDEEDQHWDHWGSLVHVQDSLAPHAMDALVALVHGDPDREHAILKSHLHQKSSGMRLSSINMVLHIGDIAYDMHEYRMMKKVKKEDKDELYNLGDRFMQVIEDVAAYVPYMVVAGNHENEEKKAAFHKARGDNKIMEGGAFDPQYEHYESRFNMPRNYDNHDSNQYYEFKYGPIWFVSVSTEYYYSYSTVDPKFRWVPDYDKVAEQYEFVEHTLKKANKNRKSTPWIIVLQHRPIYCTSINRITCRFNKLHKNGIPSREDPNRLVYGLGALYDKYMVDMVITGHEHIFELFPPNELDKQGRPRVIPDKYWWDVDRVVRHLDDVHDKVTDTHHRFGAFTDPVATTYLVVGRPGNAEEMEKLYPVPRLQRIAYYNQFSLSLINFPVAEFGTRSSLVLRQVDVNGGEVPAEFVMEKTFASYEPELICSELASWTRLDGRPDPQSEYYMPLSEFTHDREHHRANAYTRRLRKKLPKNATNGGGAKTAPGSARQKRSVATQLALDYPPQPRQLHRMSTRAVIRALLYSLNGLGNKYDGITTEQERAEFEAYREELCVRRPKKIMDLSEDENQSTKFALTNKTPKAFLRYQKSIRTTMIGYEELDKLKNYNYIFDIDLLNKKDPFLLPSSESDNSGIKYELINGGSFPFGIGHESPVESERGGSAPWYYGILESIRKSGYQSEDQQNRDQMAKFENKSPSKAKRIIGMPEVYQSKKPEKENSTKKSPRRVADRTQNIENGNSPRKSPKTEVDQEKNTERGKSPKKSPKPEADRMKKIKSPNQKNGRTELGDWKRSPKGRGETKFEPKTPEHSPRSVLQPRDSPLSNSPVSVEAEDKPEEVISGLKRFPEDISGLMDGKLEGIKDHHKMGKAIDQINAQLLYRSQSSFPDYSYEVQQILVPDFENPKMAPAIERGKDQRSSLSFEKKRESSSHELMPILMGLRKGQTNALKGNSAKSPKKRLGEEPEYGQEPKIKWPNTRMEKSPNQRQRMDKSPNQKRGMDKSPNQKRGIDKSPNRKQGMDKSPNQRMDKSPNQKPRMDKSPNHTLGMDKSPKQKPLDGPYYEETSAEYSQPEIGLLYYQEPLKRQMSKRNRRRKLYYLPIPTKNQGPKKAYHREETSDYSSKPPEIEWPISRKNDKKQNWAEAAGERPIWNRPENRAESQESDETLEVNRNDKSPKAREMKSPKFESKYTVSDYRNQKEYGAEKTKFNYQKTKNEPKQRAYDFGLLMRTQFLGIEDKENKNPNRDQYRNNKDRQREIHAEEAEISRRKDDNPWKTKILEEKEKYKKNGEISEKMDKKVEDEKRISEPEPKKTKWVQVGYGKWVKMR